MMRPRPNRRRTGAAVAVCVLVGAAPAWAADALTAGGLVEEVVSRSDSPHAFDWRAATAEVQLGYGYVDEANNFDTETFELGAGVPTGEGSMARFGLRRTQVYSTPSSNDVGRTPFRQAAQPTRYEFFGGDGYGLLEGRSMTRLTPWIPDVAHVMLAYAGAHYSLPNKGWVPRRGDPPAVLPGQEQVKTKIALELGLRWQIYLPSSFGVYFEGLYNRPMGSAGRLRSWSYFSGGLVWAIGVK